MSLQSQCGGMPTHTGLSVWLDAHTLIFVLFLVGCIPGKVKIMSLILGFPIKRRLLWQIIFLIKGLGINIFTEMSTNIRYSTFKKKKKTKQNSVVLNIEIPKRLF